MEFVITQTRNGCVDAYGTTIVEGNEASAPYDAAKIAQGLLHALDNSLQAFGYGPAGGMAEANEDACQKFSSDLRWLDVGESIRLDAIDVERSE